MKKPCIVPGCGVDLYDEGKPSTKLGTCREHRTAVEVDLDGKPHRYCQQCVKLHPIDEFDGKKKGCRKRLADHNLRYCILMFFVCILIFFISFG